MNLIIRIRMPAGELESETGDGLPDPRVLVMINLKSGALIFPLKSNPSSMSGIAYDGCKTSGTQLSWHPPYSRNMVYLD